MAKTIARYTKSLDLIALAIKEQRKGNHVNAARLFAAGAKHESAPYAVSAIEATNRAAVKASASRGKTRRHKAEAEDFEEDTEVTDVDTQDVLDSLDDGFDEDDDVEEAEAEDDFDVELDSEEDDISDIVEGRAKARAFAASLRQMRKSSRSR